MEYPKGQKHDLPTGQFVKFQPEGIQQVPGKTSTKVDVSANLQNYNNGDENFNPAKEAGKLKGGKIYTMAVKEYDITRKPPSVTDFETDKIIPVGTRIPF